MSKSVQETGVVLADTATKLDASAQGALILTGSHGGRYAGYLTLSAHPRAVIHNDAGVGKEQAGIAVIAMAQVLDVAAATASHTSCRIGDAQDMAQRGVISFANTSAAALGVCRGMPCREALLHLLAAHPSNRDPEPCGEARRVIQDAEWHKRIVLVDSASLIAAEDVGQIIVTASHGALVGGDPKMALGVDGFAAVFSDAGVGRDEAGISRLPALDQRGIAGLAVSAQSARIGDAASVFDEGVVSHVNQTAARRGAGAGEPLKQRLLSWAKLP
jgi:uncharacterized protein YunC (DUF1805 family)